MSRAVAREWREFSSKVYDDAGPMQLRDLELSFYGGAFAVLALLRAANPTSARRLLDAMFEESKRFHQKRLAEHRERGEL